MTPNPMSSKKGDGAWKMLLLTKKEYLHLRGVTQGGGGERRGRELENEQEKGSKEKEGKKRKEEKKKRKEKKKKELLLTHSEKGAQSLKQSLTFFLPITIT